MQSTLRFSCHYACKLPVVRLICPTIARTQGFYPTQSSKTGPPLRLLPKRTVFKVPNKCIQTQKEPSSDGTHLQSQHWGSRDWQISEFKTSLVYTVCSRSSRTTQKNLVSKNIKNLFLLCMGVGVTGTQVCTYKLQHTCGRGQVSGIGFLLLSCRFLGLELRLSRLLACPFTTKPSHQPSLFLYVIYILSTSISHVPWGFFQSFISYHPQQAIV